MADPVNPNPAAETQTPPQTTVTPPNQVTLPLNPPATPPATEQKALATEQQTEQKPPEKTETEAAKEVVEAAGLDYDAIVNEYQTTGALSEATTANLKETVKKMGLPETVVDTYFSNLKAQEALFMRNVYDVTGGEENYQQMAAWARESMTPAELKTFSDLAESGDPEQAMMAVKLLHTQYQQAAQTGGKRLKATSGGPALGPLFQSQKELAAAMRDPEYAGNPAKQREVQERLARSVAAGVFKG